MSLVWQNKLNSLDGTRVYDVEVERKNYNEGILRIKFNDNILLEEEVSMDYGAIFGPDVVDLVKWQERCIEFVDSLKDS